MMVSGGGGTAAHPSFHSHVVAEFDEPDRTSQRCDSEGSGTGMPERQGFAESLNGRLRDECLNINWFMSVRHAREITESWRQDYNDVSPHSSLKGKTPKEVAGSMAGLFWG